MQRRTRAVARWLSIGRHYPVVMVAETSKSQGNGGDSRGPTDTYELAAKLPFSKRHFRFPSGTIGKVEGDPQKGPIDIGRTRAVRCRALSAVHSLPRAEALRWPRAAASARGNARRL